MALDQAKGFIRSPIISDTARLDELGEEVRQLDLFGLPAAADVFDARRVRAGDQATSRGRRGERRTKGLASRPVPANQHVLKVRLSPHREIDADGPGCVTSSAASLFNRYAMSNHRHQCLE